MITKPHFYSLRSRLGMINPPWKQEGLNIGVEKGADAILTDEFVKSFHGVQADTYDYPAPETIEKETIYDTIAGYSLRAIERIESTIKEGETQVVVGGDHSVSLASISALTKRIDPAKIACIRIDSHPDVLNIASTTTQNFHGMWFRPFIEQFDEPAVDAVVGGRRFKPEQVLFIGNLDSEAAEKAFITKYDMHQISVDNLRNTIEASQQYISTFLAKYTHVHLNIDIDGFDKSVAPATGLPADHGLLPTDLQFLFDIIRDHPSKSIDLVEVNPQKPGGGQTAALAQTFLQNILI